MLTEVDRAGARPPTDEEIMANCVTCGDELHPERAEKYDYCTKPECQERNARGLTMVAVGVNKAADQYVVLNDHTEKEMASGRYKKRPEAAGVVRAATPRRPRRAGSPDSAFQDSPTATPPPRWSDVQESLAVIYRAMGMNPDQIAKKLGVSRYLVTQMLLSASSQGKR
jgi:hypothetical protein